MSSILRVVAIVGCVGLACGEFMSKKLDRYIYSDSTCSGAEQLCGYRPQKTNDINCYQDECCQMNFTAGNTLYGYCLKSGGVNCSPVHSYNYNQGCPMGAVRPAGKRSKMFPLPGPALRENESLHSPNGLVRLSLQADGNMVISEKVTWGHPPIWSSHTEGHPNSILHFHVTDGNLVLNYQDGSGKLVTTWRTGQQKGAQMVALRDDCNLVMSDKNENIVWALGTHCQFNRPDGKHGLHVELGPDSQPSPDGELSPDGEPVPDSTAVDLVDVVM